MSSLWCEVIFVDLYFRLIQNKQYICYVRDAYLRIVIYFKSKLRPYFGAG
jgi:hypothetical protein